MLPLPVQKGDSCEHKGTRCCCPQEVRGKGGVNSGGEREMEVSGQPEAGQHNEILKKDSKGEDQG